MRTRFELRRMALLCAVTAALTGTVHAASLELASMTLPAGETKLAVPVQLDAGSGEKVAGIQFDIEYDASAIDIVSVTIGPAAAEVGKSLNSNSLGKGTLRIIVAGMNLDAIPSGQVASLAVTAAKTSKDGVYPLRLSNVLMSNPVGRAVSARTANGSVTIGSPSSPAPDSQASGCSGGGTPSLFDVLVVAAIMLALTRIKESTSCEK